MEDPSEQQRQSQPRKKKLSIVFTAILVAILVIALSIILTRDNTPTATTVTSSNVGDNTGTSSGLDGGLENNNTKNSSMITTAPDDSNGDSTSNSPVPVPVPVPTLTPAAPPPPTPPLTPPPTPVDPEINVVNVNAKNPTRDGVQFISPTCSYTCRTDRLPHESALYPGQVLCNKEHRFGLTEEGDFFAQDCLLNTKTIFWSPTNVTADQFPIHLEIQTNAYWQIISDPTNEILFEAQPKGVIDFSYLCLYSPKLHCPYVHLHPDGVTVINWIDGGWTTRNVLQLYPDLDK
ncbi:MAG: hypothetical protein SGBAC_010215 [Bacillariaceae sp.]